jgi:antirestriction protein
MTDEKIAEIAGICGYDEEVVRAYIELGITASEDAQEIADEISEAYQGEHRSDEDFVQSLLEDTGELPKDLPHYIHIDWESTARDIMMDYSAENGHYFRNV